MLSRPLDLGADIVIHSGTKYIAGHNDSLVGLIIAKGQALCDRIAYIQNGAGAVLSPFDSWFCLLYTSKMTFIDYLWILVVIVVN